MSIKTPATHPIRLYRHALSGHSHRIEAFLEVLRLPFELVDVDLARGEHKRANFLAKNPFGQVPVLEDGEAVIADSAAILVYLASRYDTSGRYYPADPVARARVQQWLSAAAGPLASGPAAARLAAVFGVSLDVDRARAIAAGLFAIMDSHLGTSPFFAGEHPTIADIALYSYTAHAPEGGIPLEPYGHVREWLARVEAIEGFVPMKRTP